MKKTIYTLILLMALLVLAACNSSGGEAETAVMEDTTEQPAAEMAGDEEAMAEEDETMMEEDEAMTEHDDTMMDDSESAMDSTMEDDEAMAEEDEAMTEHDEAMMDDSESVMELMMDDDEAMMDDDMEEGQMMESPLWQTIALTNVRSGESFTLADFSGKTVFVEPMATWCTNCRRQLGNVSQARATLDDDNTVFVALSVETNLSDEALANYTDETGFDWVFAVATPELVQELAATFGQSITNPPSTPHFVIRPDGTYTELVTGIESPDEIISRVQAEG